MPHGPVWPCQLGLAGFLPERIPERLRELRAEQEALRQTLRSYPEPIAGRLRALEKTAERAGRGAEAAEIRLEALRQRTDALHPWQRRERGELSRRVAHEEELLARLAAEARAGRAQARALAEGPQGPEAWEAAHPGVRARYRELAPELRRVEALAREMAIARQIASPADSIVRALGRRPAQPDLRPAWDRAVAAIAGYRHRRDLADGALSALGPPPVGGAERVAWRMAVREAERASTELGRSVERELLVECPGRGIEFDV